MDLPTRSAPRASGIMTSIAEQWKREAKRIQPTLQQVAQINQKLPPVEERILSVNQLDAQILDKELFDILRSQFMRIFAFFKVRLVFPLIFTFAAFYAW